jgi:hypothetical protein
MSFRPPKRWRWQTFGEEPARRSKQIGLRTVAAAPAQMYADEVGAAVRSEQNRPTNRSAKQPRRTRRTRSFVVFVIFVVKKTCEENKFLRIRIRNSSKGLLVALPK